MPPLEVRFTDPSDRHPVYGFDNKFYSKGVELSVPAQVDAALGKELQRVARAAFIALGCRDVGRIDVRLDAAGRVSFIECNPLPGLAPGFSDLCLIANASGMEYRTLIGEILASALRRMRERKGPAAMADDAAADRPGAGTPWLARSLSWAARVTSSSA